MTKHLSATLLLVCALVPFVAAQPAPLKNARERWLKGNYEEAKEAYEKLAKEAECRWFVRTYTRRSDNDDDIKDPDELLLVGLAGSEHARWNNLSDQFEFILNEVYKDALKNEPNFWPAELAAALLLLEKFNRG